MRIWVDGQALQSTSKYRGIGRYIIGLLKAIMVKYPDTEMLISFNAAMIDSALEAKELVSDFIAEENIFFWEGLPHLGEAKEGYSKHVKFNERLLAYHVACLNPDIAWSVSPFEGSVDNCVPLLGKFGHDFLICSMFYDAIPYRYSDLYLSTENAYKYYKRRLHCYKNFDHNLTISNFSDNEIRDILAIKNSTPIYAGLSNNILEQSICSSNQNKSSKLRSMNEYMLYVGGFDWRKNINLIAEAMYHAPRTIQKGIKFVVVGDKNQGAIQSICAQWREYNLPEENLIFTGFVDDDELIDLYKSAKFVVQPSFMEGFGLVALEALACDTPVLVSTADALTEIINCSEAQFSPTDSIQLSQLITKVIRNSKFSQKILKESKASLSNYSWEKSADLTISAFIQLLEDNSKKQFDQKVTIQTGSSTMLGFEIDKESMATAFAIATPQEADAPSRLLIDATTTTKKNHGTGIQRVVTSICKTAQLNTASRTPAIIVNCDIPMGFHEIQTKPKKNEVIFQSPANKERALIGFHKNDTLLLLDSSWVEFQHSQGKIKGAKLKGAQIISVVYDVIPILTPAFCVVHISHVYSQWLKAALDYSTGFVCISKAVADEIYGLLEAIEFPRPMRIGYWHLGADFSTKTKVPVQRHGAENRFLMVGTLEPRKGHGVALAAFEHLWALGHNDILVIVGRLGWNIDSLAQKIVNHPEFGKKLLWFKNADDYELAQQYELADAIICASYAEGFGLPIIEAAHYNKPVIASDIPVFHEVAYDNDVSYFDVGSSESLIQKIVNFEKPQKVRLKDKETTYLSWKESTDQLCDVILEDDWYKIYTPKKKSNYSPTLFEGFAQIKHLTEIKDKQHTLTLVDGPYQSTEEDKYELIVKVRNLSRSNWSSMAADVMGIGAINLACRQLSANGQLVDYPGNRAAIPLTLTPNMDYYFSIHIPKEAYLAGNKFVVEFVQEGVSWWGNGLDIN